MDIWVITPEERRLFEKQFYSLGPINGDVLGENAKGFFMLSKLSSNILGVIWELSDVNCDGKLNLNEFLIACKLIQLKLRGNNIPTILPPPLLSLISSGSIVKAVSPTSNLYSTINTSIAKSSVKSELTNELVRNAPPNVIGVNESKIITGPSLIQLPVDGGAGLQRNVISSGSGFPAAVAEMSANKTSTGTAATGLLNSAVPNLIDNSLRFTTASGNVASAMPATGWQAASLSKDPLAAPIITDQQQSASSDDSTSLMFPNGMVTSSKVPPIATDRVIMSSSQPSSPPPLITASVKPSDSPVQVPSTDSNGGLLVSPTTGAPELVHDAEWAVPYQTKLKYTQLFNATDKNRIGFVTGVQAKNLLVETGLPHSVLAQIWRLADLDADGKLSCDEFVLAMHLCDITKQGQKIVVPLPADMIPPSFRSHRKGSVDSTTGGSPVVQQQQRPEAAAATATSPSLLNQQGSFEEKRKENFERGQIELNKRRQALLEFQNQLEQSKRKTSLENDGRAKSTASSSTPPPLTSSPTGVDISSAVVIAVDGSNAALPVTCSSSSVSTIADDESAAKQQQKQQQEKWLQQYESGLQHKYEKEQEAIGNLNAENEKYSARYEELVRKYLTLTKSIDQSRSNISELKSAIDGMRVTRDTRMSSIVNLKVTLKKQNQLLITINQEKGSLKFRKKMSSGGEKGNVAPSSQQLVDTELLEERKASLSKIHAKIDNLESQVSSVSAEVNNAKNYLNTIAGRLRDAVTGCEQLYSDYTNKKTIILTLRCSISSKTSHAGLESQWPVDNDAFNSAPGGIPSSNKYRAIYEFFARNEDELSFHVGDIITVTSDGTEEPNWLYGELRGKRGWFPESYVEYAASNDVNDISNNYAQEPVRMMHNLNDIAEVSEEFQPSEEVVTDEQITSAAVDNSSVTPSDVDAVPVSFQVNAIYAWTAHDQNQLSFNKDDVINVTKEKDSWYYGELNGSFGWFPASYVVKSTVTAVVDNAVENADNDYYIAIYPYHSNEPGDLSFSEDSIIKITKKEGEWWTGILDGKEGVFPSNYVQKLLPQELNYKIEIAKVISPYKANGQEQLTLEKDQLVMIKKKTTTGWWKGEIRGKFKKRQVGWFPASYVKILDLNGNKLNNFMSSSQTSSLKTTPQLPSDTVKPQLSPVQPQLSPVQPVPYEQVIALYKYTALNPDELSFQKNDIIKVLTKEEPHWWKGELNGVTGLFPSNYVAAL